jgi:hypothetical protein
LVIRIETSTSIGRIALLIPIVTTVPTSVVIFETHVRQAGFFVEDYDHVINCFLEEVCWVAAGTSVIEIHGVTVEDFGGMTWPIVGGELHLTVGSLMADIPYRVIRADNKEAGRGFNDIGDLQLMQWAAVSTCLGPTRVPEHWRPLFHTRPMTLYG